MAMTAAMGSSSRKAPYTKRLAALESERSSWITHWRDISDYLLPRQGRFLVTDRNDGAKRHNNILDSTGTRAQRILAAGMMSGITSPARPWFRLLTPDNNLNDYGPVKAWLFEVEDRVRYTFARSNVYRALHQLYSELGGFGTGAVLLLEDFDEVVRGYPLTVGEYCIATDYRGQVNTIYRKYQVTVAQLVSEFGKNAVSSSVRTNYENGNLDQWVTVVHAIEPRGDYDPDKRDQRNMPYRSCYFEEGGDGQDVLRESGFRDFPALVARWDVTGGDVYGNGPGMEALGDVKQLQTEQLRKARAIDYQTDPPLQLPSALKNSGADLLPGGSSYYDSNGPHDGIRTAFNVDLRLDHLLLDIQDVRERINQAFYVDLFMMLANDTRSNITAREIAERHEEKLIMLGPVLERLHSELLNPLIDRTFNILLRNGLLPPPPRELQGVDLKVEYVSMLAQAQRAVGLGAVDRLVATVASLAQLDPTARHKLDLDEAIDTYADMLGTPPRIVRPDEAVAALREQEAQALQAQQQAAVAAQAVDSAKTLSDTHLDNGNALARLMGAV